jgi:uncharacterized protein YjgD (DUF1641 family)
MEKTMEKPKIPIKKIPIKDENEKKVTMNDDNIEKYIEKHIEEKLNNLMLTLPDKLPEKNIAKPIYKLTIKELYKNTLQNMIDIINEITEAYSRKDYYDVQNYMYVVIDILSKDDRKTYVGIIIIFLSFIIYFIDGASV